jgi:hypothetical protein
MPKGAFSMYEGDYNRRSFSSCAFPVGIIPGEGNV